MLSAESMKLSEKHDGGENWPPNPPSAPNPSVASRLHAEHQRARSVICDVGPNSTRYAH